MNVCRGVFRTQPNIYDGTPLPKSQKSFIVGARLGFKYVSGIDFTVKKVYRSHYLSDKVKVDFKNFHCVLVSPINKTHICLMKKV